MQIKTNELGGAALDWAVAKAVGLSATILRGGVVIGGGEYEDPDAWRPSSGWSQSGPLIEQYLMKLTPVIKDEPTVWHALMDDGQKLFSAPGPTPLVAAMRALVAAKLGDMAEVPDELMVTNEEGE